MNATLNHALATGQITPTELEQWTQLIVQSEEITQQLDSLLHSCLPEQIYAQVCRLFETRTVIAIGFDRFCANNPVFAALAKQMTQTRPGPTLADTAKGEPPTDGKPETL